MTLHRHLGFRYLAAFALLWGLVGAAPATARHEYRAGYDVTELAAGLEAATDEVRRELRRGFRGRRGGEDRLERDLAELQRQAYHFRHRVGRNAPRSRAARTEVAVLLQRFYDADRTIRRTAVPGSARSEFERARFFMDTLIDRYGGYRHFQHVRPSGNGDRHRHHPRWRRDHRRWR